MLRTEVPEIANAEAILKDLDMTDELREAAAIRISSYQQRMANLYNRHIKPRAFRARDLVLRKRSLRTQLTLSPTNFNQIGKDHT